MPEREKVERLGLEVRDSYVMLEAVPDAATVIGAHVARLVRELVRGGADLATIEVVVAPQEGDPGIMHARAMGSVRR